MIIRLREATEADELVCADGEIERIPLMPIFKEKSDEPEGTPGRPDYTPPIILPIKKSLSIGNFNVYLVDGSLYFAYWHENEQNYRWIGLAPSVPSVKFTAEPVPLPPYSTLSDELPQIELQFALESGTEEGVMGWLTSAGGKTCAEDTKRSICEALESKIEEFLVETESSGLFYRRRSVRAAWRVSGGDYWLPTVPTTVGSEDRLEARIITAKVNDGVLTLRVELSEAPYNIKAEVGASADAGWEAVITGAGLFVSGTKATDHRFLITDVAALVGGGRAFRFRETVADADSAWRETAIVNILRLPATATLDLPSANAVKADFYEISPRSLAVDNIFKLGDALLINVYSRSPFAENRLYISRPGAAPIIIHRTVTGGEEIIGIEASLRPHALTYSDYETAYAFTAGGVLALTPSATGLRKTQRLSRDVLVAPDAVTLLPDSLLFMSQRGLLKIKGTVITPVEEGELTVDEEGSPPEVEAWRPVTQGGKVSTRALKFGDPFALKRLRKVRMLWPDGQPRPFAVYGGLKPGRWHLLGRSECGAVRLMGSGWRFFRVEFPLPLPDRVEKDWFEMLDKPLIDCEIEKL